MSGVGALRPCSGWKAVANKAGTSRWICALPRLHPGDHVWVLEDPKAGSGTYPAPVRPPSQRSDETATILRPELDFDDRPTPVMPPRAGGS